MPKLHFLDPGICRAIRRKQGDVNGHELESAFIAEVYKQVKNSRLPLELHHLRSSDGREVDLLIEREDGYFAFECKQTAKSSKKDARHLRGLQEILDKPLLGSMVISNDRNVRIEGTDHEKVSHCPFPLLLS
jgi:predicted AAA+ superfamily ATPase